MRISVIISTYNRASSLRQTLLSLRSQTFRDFEVVVVNGPSTDDTEDVLNDFAGEIRSLRCDKTRLSMSRNIGLQAAAGDVMAFLDDDAIPTPTWLDELAEAYREPNVGAAGGLVYDHTGVKFQFRYAACFRNGHPVFDIEPPLERYTVPYAEPVAYLQGTNMSFSREAIRSVGGFDENILHYYDDVDTCLSVIDHGYKLKALDGAAVHHKFLASHVRNVRRITMDPFNKLSDRAYFALRHSRRERSLHEIVADVLAAARQLRADADHHVNTGEMTPDEREFHNKRIEDALEFGLKKGFAAARATCKIPAENPAPFLPFRAYRARGKRMKLCFVSREYPPGDFGGPGRYTHELASGLGRAGHETHVITRSPDTYRLDYEDGVWVHRLPLPDRLEPALDAIDARTHIFDMAAVYHEVCKIHEQGPVDLVSAPLWLCESLVCTFDDRFPTVTTLITAMKAVAGLADWAKNQTGPQQLVALEEELVRKSQYLHAVSRPILSRAVAEYDADPDKAFVANLGLADRSGQYSRRRRHDGRVRVLYVGRLETRKGAGLFLDAVARLAPQFPHAEFVMVGKDIPTDEGDTHRGRFQKRYEDDPGVLDKVTFAGIATEDELYQHYADCDVVCLPSMYESFGLVFVEAMTFGKPVIGSRAGGMVEVVVDGEQGYLIPPGDVDALTASLHKLIACPATREAFGKRSRELYLQRFSVPVMVQNCEARYREVIEKHRRRPDFAPGAPAPLAKVADTLAEVLTRRFDIPARAAKATATRLLDPIHQPIDLPRYFQKHWDAPIEEFIHTLFRSVFNRQPRTDEVQSWMGHLHNVPNRITLVRAFFQAEEARGAYPEQCMTNILLACGPGPIPGYRDPAEDLGHDSATFQSLQALDQPRPSWLRHRLSSLRYAGHLLRYVRRAVRLPWAFHKFTQDFAGTNRLIQATASRQASTDKLIRQEVIPLVRELIDRQHAMLAAMKGSEAALLTSHAEVRRRHDDQVAALLDAVNAISGGNPMELPDMESMTHPGSRDSVLRAS